MKKRTTKTTEPDVLDRDVDFERFGPARRNAFAGAGERGGPSLASLWEMPQISRDAAPVRRGRPGKTKKAGVRSVRLSEAIWKEIEAKARSEDLNVDEAVRAAVLRWLRRAR